MTGAGARRTGSPPPAAGKYRSRPEDKERNAVVLELLREGKSWAKVMRLAKCSRSTVAKMAKQLAAPET